MCGGMATHFHAHAFTLQPAETVKASGDSEMALYCLVLLCKRWLAFNNSFLSSLQGLFSNKALFMLGLVCRNAKALIIDSQTIPVLKARSNERVKVSFLQFFSQFRASIHRCHRLVSIESQITHADFLLNLAVVIGHAVYVLFRIFNLNSRGRSL